MLRFSDFSRYNLCKIILWQLSLVVFSIIPNVNAGLFSPKPEIRKAEVDTVFIAMNRFKIAHGKEEGFVEVWRSRDSYLDSVPGFVSFNLLQGPQQEDHTLFASHTIWESREAFEAWTQSESFVKAHSQRSAPKGTYLGHPDLELFESVLETVHS